MQCCKLLSKWPIHHHDNDHQVGPANGHLVRSSPVAVSHVEPLCHEVRLIDGEDKDGIDDDDSDGSVDDDDDEEGESPFPNPGSF